MNYFKDLFEWLNNHKEPARVFAYWDNRACLLTRYFENEHPSFGLTYVGGNFIIGANETIRIPEDLIHVLKTTRPLTPANVAARL